MKKLSTKSKALEISCNFNDFVKNYVSAKKTKDDFSIKFLILNLNHNFILWQHLVYTNCYDENITTSTLMTLLKMDNKPKATLCWKLQTLKSYLKYNSLTFTDLCIEALLMHINKETKIYPEYKNEFKLLFFINKEIKTFLFKIIRRILQKQKKDYYTNSSYYYKNSVYNDIYLDFKLLSNIKLNQPLLFSALIYYITVDQKFPNIKKHFKLTDSEYLFLKEDLCQLIKTLPSSS